MTSGFTIGQAAAFASATAKAVQNYHRHDLADESHDLTLTSRQASR